MRQRKLKPAIPVKRQGYWYLERRVPARFRMRDPRKTAKLSTGIRITDDPRGIAARRGVAELDAELLRLWERELPHTCAPDDGILFKLTHCSLTRRGVRN